MIIGSLDRKSHLNKLQNVKSFGLSNVKPVRQTKKNKRRTITDYNPREITSPEKQTQYSSNFSMNVRTV